MSAFSDMVDALFGNDDMAVDAVYTPAGAGDPLPDPVRVIRRSPDTATQIRGFSIVSATTLLEVRVSEIAAPSAGDSFAIGAETFTVQGAPERRDPDRLVWTLDTVPAA